MRRTKPQRVAVTLLTVANLILPSGVVQGVEQAAPTTEALTIMAPVDISIGADGRLTGSVVDEAGTALPATTVYLLSEQGALAGQTLTDETGRFAFEAVQGGVYEIVADGAATIARCWAPNTAPPNACAQVLICVGQVQRGQVHPAVSKLASPWVITGIVVAAIVIPVAIHNNRSDRKAASN